MDVSRVGSSANQDESALNIEKARNVKRLVHFSDGVLEEYSTDENEDSVDNKINEKKVLDPTTLAWVPYIWFHMSSLGSKTLSVCDYLGERIAWIFGITSPKYQYELDEAKRMVEEEEKKQSKLDEEYAGWTTKSTDGKSSDIQLKEPKVSTVENISEEDVTSFANKVSAEQNVEVIDEQEVEVIAEESDTPTASNSSPVSQVELVKEATPPIDHHAIDLMPSVDDQEDNDDIKVIRVDENEPEDVGSDEEYDSEEEDEVVEDQGVVQPLEIIKNQSVENKHVDQSQEVIENRSNESNKDDVNTSSRLSESPERSDENQGTSKNVATT